MAKPSGSIKIIQTPDEVPHEVIPDRLGNNGYVATPPTLSADSILALRSDIPTVNNKTITITQGGVIKGSFTLNQSSNETINLDLGGLETLTSPAELTTLSDGLYLALGGCQLRVGGTIVTTISANDGGFVYIGSDTINSGTRNCSIFSGSYYYHFTFNTSGSAQTIYWTNLLGITSTQVELTEVD